MDRTEQQEPDIATAGVVGRPILFFPAAVLAGLILDRLLPLPIAFPQAASLPLVVGGAMIVVGAVIFAAGVQCFTRAETPLPTNQPARALVTTGVYRWSRNPIYLSFLLMFSGIGLAAHSPWVLILALPLAITVRLGVVAREEAYLEQRFDGAYRDYKARVRRWL